MTIPERGSAPPSGVAVRLAEHVWSSSGLAASLARVALAPAEWAYRAVSATRNTLYDRGALRVHSVPVPVISIGNLSVGGTGKTPITRFLADTLRGSGARPAILHRGYGGDEPALHRAWNPDIPVFVGGDRLTSGAAAAAAGATVLLLDDGFQHRRLARDLDIVLVAAEDWTPKPRMLPRGPWREPPAALGRADLVIVTRKTAPADRARDVARALRSAAPVVVRAALEPAGWQHDGATGAAPDTDAIAVVGVARPGLFLENAVSAGARIVDAFAFADHHAFDAADARTILDAAGSRPIVTTEKDAVKLRSLLPEHRLWILLQRVRIEEGETLIADALERFS